MSTSLIQAANWMAATMGLDLNRDRDEVVGFVNRYRNMLFNNYPEHQLFDEHEQCFKLLEFQQNCSGSACSTWYGFTATLDMDGIVGAWESLDPISTRSRWREVHRGKRNPTGVDVEIIPVTGRFATERDMTEDGRLSLYAHNRGDAGKLVVIIARDSTGKEFRLDVTLGDDTHAIVNEIVSSISSVTLPVDLCGPVSIYQNEDYLLSKYPVGIPTPQFKRYKVNDVCPSGCILVQSAKRYIALSEDHEVVELGDQLVIEAAAKFFKYGHSTINPEELKASRVYKQDMMTEVEGHMSRKRGKENKDSLVNFAPNPRRLRQTALPGYRSRRRRR